MQGCFGAAAAINILHTNVLNYATLTVAQPRRGINADCAAVRFMWTYSIRVGQNIFISVRKKKGQEYPNFKSQPSPWCHVCALLCQLIALLDVLGRPGRDKNPHVVHLAVVYWQLPALSC